MQMKKGSFYSFASWEVLQSFVVSWLLFCWNAKLFCTEKKQFSAVKSASVMRVIMINFYTCLFSEKHNFKSKKAQACLLNDPLEYIPVSLRSVITGWGKNWLFKVRFWSSVRVLALGDDILHQIKQKLSLISEWIRVRPNLLKRSVFTRLGIWGLSVDICI